MVSSVLASVLQSYLGQYLELSDSSISVGSEVRLNNVKLKESALSDLGLPVKCVHGKVSKLVIKIPWMSLFTKKTTIEVEGLHLLVVPSTSVKYDDQKELLEQNEAKQKRLERAEQAKQMETEQKKAGTQSDTFAERLVANIIKNLEVTIKRVHLRYEDKQTGSGRYPFAAGVTLDSILMNTIIYDPEDANGGEKNKLKVFMKHVELNSLALYWRPKANLYSDDAKARDDVIDLMFDTNIGTRENPATKLKYLLGPISSEATLQWCPNPAIFDYKVPEVDLAINMEELCLSLTKYQYQDFVMLLQSFEFMSRANQFRKYKARNGLENLPNYNGRLKDLWKFAFDCIYEEEVMRKLNNWSWDHMKEHVTRCKAYRELYKKKLSSKPSEDLKKQLRRLEDSLDELNIRIQRQLAEREVEQLEKQKKANGGGGGGIWSWFTGAGKKEADDSGIGGSIKKFEEALTNDEKSKLYEVLDYQENAHHGIYPKSFVAKKLGFKLHCLLITIRDDDFNDALVLQLNLNTVASELRQRPSADYAQLEMSMKALTVTGLEKRGTITPTIVSTRAAGGAKGLLNFSFENNPPSDPDGDLNQDMGSLYDQRIRFLSSPLEIIYDARTFNRLVAIFKTPDDLNLATLQQTAYSKLKEYKATTTLGLQYVIENHNLIDVDIQLMSSYIILPHKGLLTDSCACAVANLGSIKIKSRPISAETRSLKDMSLKDLTETFKRTLRDQAYDKFNVTLERMQLIVAMPHEEWRSHAEKEMSPLFLLKPTSLRVMFQYCLIKNDPEMPLAKINGSLEEISINISDYRLIKMAQILDSLFEPDEEEPVLHRTESEESMQSALSSLANTGSLIQHAAIANVPDLAALRKRTQSVDAEEAPSVQVTKVIVDFSIGRVNLSLTQQVPHSNEDQKLFHFTITKLEALAKVRTFDIEGKFSVGGLTCEHLLLKTPTTHEPVKILRTLLEQGRDDTLLELTYTDVNKLSPDFQTVHEATLKKLDLKLSTVYINLHQDAILDIVDKVTKFISEVSSHAKHLMMAVPEKPQPAEVFKIESQAEGEQMEPEQESTADQLKRQNAKKALKRRMSVKAPANLARWAFRAKKKVSLQSEEVELKVTATLKSVKFDLMTSKVHFASLKVKDLQASYVQTKSQKLITARLVDFKVIDPINTTYPKIAESMDQRVFDASVTLYDTTPAMKIGSPDVVDVKVEAKMGRVRVVFLMKFINDFLTFLEPFSGAKEVVAERANMALEGATKTMIDAYAKATRAQLDIQLDAPLIIVPVHSTSSTTLIADLGNLRLANRFSMDGGNIFDEMHFNLTNLQLFRARIEDNNEVTASCLIIHPITFELDLKRNMNGAMKKGDPAEIKATGTLYEVKLEMSKSDFDVLMAILLNNFSEKGSFEKVKNSQEQFNKANLSLPVKSKYSGSRTSLLSNHSLQLQEALKMPERDPQAHGVEFNFMFRGFSADLHSGSTPLEKVDEARSAATALARIQVKLMAVDGHVLVNSAIVAKAYLENCMLEDNRLHESKQDANRIVRLLEAKPGSRGSSRGTRMIDIKYEKDDVGDQNLDVVIYSFVLVGSVSYLLEIANFFVQDSAKRYEWQTTSESSSPSAAVPSQSNKMSIMLQIEEPDIFLVENIEDINSDALMLNTELQFKFVAAPNQLSMMASLTNIRCYTCRFNPKHREETLAQILQPCTLSFIVSQPEGHGMRVNANVSDLCLNVSPHSIYIIQSSVAAFLESMAKSDDADKNVGGALKEEDHSLLWNTKQFVNEDFWFLKADEEGVEALESLNTLSSTDASAAVDDDQQAIIKINNLVIKIESGLGNNTIPLLLLESSFSCDLRNWSGPRMSLIGSLNLEIAYYNSKLALWEPVIEPVCLVKPDGGLLKKRWDMNITLQSNAAHDYYGSSSALTSPAFDEADGFLCPENLPPLMVISLQSREILEVTVTKTFIGVLATLGESFSSVTKSKKKELPVAPFIVQNFTGKPLTILLDSKGFKYFAKDDKPGRIQQLELPHDEEIRLFLFKDRTQEVSEYISPLQEQTEQAEASLRLRIGGEKGTFELPVSKADKRFFPFPFRGDEMGDHHGMVSEIKVENGCKYIILRTIVQIKNHFDRPVNIFTYDENSRYLRLANLKPDETFNVPIKNVYTSPYEFSFQVDEEGANMGLECFNWRELILKDTHSQTIHCTNRNGGPGIFLSCLGTTEEIFLEKTGKLSSSCYVLDIRPVLVLKNCLPVKLHYAIDESESQLVEPGGSAHLHGVTLGRTKVTLKILEFRGTDWTCVQVIEAEMAELCSWRFSASGDDETGLKLDLSINTAVSQGTQVVSIYSPFWMVNKTGKMLTYRGQDPQNVIYHSNEDDGMPMMFAYTAKSFLGKRKASIRIEESAWSDPFTLDTIEDAGKVTCKKGGGKKMSYSVGVNINMSKASLTKIITFTPYYIIVNTSGFSISVRELEGSEFVDVPSGECVPFWPAFGANNMIACVTGTPELTPKFTMQAGGSSLLMLDNKYGAINAECRLSNSECLLTLSSYTRGLAPVQLINGSKDCTITYCEAGARTKKRLAPGESVLYTWMDPSGPRKLIWSIHGYTDEYTNPLVSDGEGVIELETNSKYVGWVSFLDGMQRVLLFTDDLSVCYSLAHTTGENERIDQELNLSIHGIGISVVNNSPSCSYELMYTSITSSDIVWEIKRAGKTRYKPLTRAQCDALEEDFQLYQREKSIGKRTSDQRTLKVASSKDVIVVNYVESKMFQPSEGSIRRQFEQGLWLQLRSSVHQTQIHAKINRIQIDNQMMHCLFPVIMAPVPPPKSVLAESIPKPFIELSVLEYKSPEHTNMRQFKYVHALVQELHIKVDQGLLNALMDLLEEEEILDEDLHEFLKEDLVLASKPLKDIVKLQGSKGLKDFYDYLHLSPLKVHVSFSLTSYKSSSKINTTRRSNFLGLFLQSLGVTITDTDDIIFRLAYFERKHNFYSQQDLFSEMIRHYMSQAIKQAYVIILGLDVIGNPFGLVVGVSRSVEDLFYEPFQGAVEGPSEFAEGLVIGVRSVFSGVVGGAAGTFSRITGALGKGLASLTFDEKFQSKRREAIKKRGRQTLGESFARSGKGLVMGIVDGVTGVATKPLEGAREEGVGGFFKGVGKGVVGLVARPTGGLIDFASGTFDSVKRVAEVSEEVGRIRPARFLHPDGVVTNYNLREATGNKILKELEKGRYAESDAYVVHAEIADEPNSSLLITTKRILYVDYKQVLGTWTITWEFEYGAISGPPPTGKEQRDNGAEVWYIIIKPKEERKKILGLFGGSESGKKVFMTSRDLVQSLARTIEDLRTSHSS